MKISDSLIKKIDKSEKNIFSLKKTENDKKI